MSSPCGIPGCKYSKLTPDGNKSFKCKFWQMKSMQKNESISLEISKNNDPEIQRMRGYLRTDSFFKANVPPAMICPPTPIAELPINKTISEVSSEPADQIDSKPRKVQPVELNQGEETDQQTQVETSEVLTEKEKENIMTELKDISFSDISDNIIQQKFQQIVKTMSSIARFLPTEQHIKETVDQQVTVEKPQQNDQPENKTLKSINERINVLEELVNDDIISADEHPQTGLMQTNQVPKELRITYNRLIRYSKHLMAEFSYGKTDCPRFLISKDLVKLKYLNQMFPYVFRIIGAIKYDGNEGKQFRDQDIRYWPEIIMVPSVEFIHPKYHDPNRIVIFNDEEYVGLNPNYNYHRIDMEDKFEAKILHVLNDLRTNYYYFEFADKIPHPKRYGGLEWKDKFIKVYASNLTEFNNKYCSYEILNKD